MFFVLLVVPDFFCTQFSLERPFFCISLIPSQREQTAFSASSFPLPITFLMVRPLRLQGERKYLTFYLSVFSRRH